MATLLSPPGPTYRLPGQALFALRRDPIAFLSKLAHEYGDIAHFRLLGRDAFFVNHPDYIQDILVTHARSFSKGLILQRGKRLVGDGLLTSEGAFHLRQRRLIQPAFHRKRIAAYGEVMVEHTREMMAGWRADETVNLSEEMMRLTLLIVAKTLFGSDVAADVERVGRALDVLFGQLPTRLLPEFVERLPLPHNRRFMAARAKLDEIIYRMIREHRASGDQGDLLSMLLMAQDEEGEGGGMSDEQVRAEAITLFIAGHETTANALTWTWYLLSQHPEVEARLHEEVDRVLGGRPPTMADMEQLPYTRQVLAEAMRLRPPVWAMGRMAREEYRLDGYLVPKGATILMSQWVMNHDARYYPDPERFDPMRWTPEAQAARPKFAYFPFGGGARLCIGEPFAWMEGVLVLATIAQQWQLRLAPGARVVLEPLVTLRPKHGMPMRLTRRGEGAKVLPTGG